MKRKYPGAFLLEESKKRLVISKSKTVDEVIMLIVTFDEVKRNGEELISVVDKVKGDHFLHYRSKVAEYKYGFENNVLKMKLLIIA